MKRGNAYRSKVNVTPTRHKSYILCISIIHNDGRYDTVLNAKWSQKGRLFIYNLLKANGILPKIEQDMTA